MAYTTINKSTDYFNTKLYSGNDTNGHAITGVGFQPDWTWIKCRTHTEDHNLYDAVRGAQKSLVPNSTQAEGDYSTVLQSFNTDGFTVGTSGWVNDNGKTYASWNWKANGQGSSNTDGSINTTYTSVNTTAGFSIVKYTGTDVAGATVGHGLGAVPKMIILKRLVGSGYDWVVYHKDKTAGLYLNSTGVNNDSSANSIWFNGTAPTSSVFSIGTDGRIGDATDFIAYCFAEKTGYSKFGSYTGNGSSSSPTFIYTGFKPKFVIVKNTSQTDDWFMHDDKRDGYNDDNEYLFASANYVEGVNTNRIRLLSNGFSVPTTDKSHNVSGNNYIFMAFGQSLVGSNNVPCTAR